MSLPLGYAATVELLVVDGRRVLTIFAPVGRMALTNSLMHWLICVVLSYGFGFALWWRIGASTAMAIAGAIIAAQWRRLTYGQPLALRAPLA